MRSIPFAIEIATGITFSKLIFPQSVRKSTHTFYHMRSPKIIANWKSNKTVKETKEWFAEAHSLLLSTPYTAEVIICPPFPLLPLCQSLIREYNLAWKLGAQDVSAFSEGRHTGEVSARLLKDFVHYVLIGHSERRRQLGESDEFLSEKVKQAQASLIEPFYFAQTVHTPIPLSVTTVVYEPPGAISPAPPERAEDVEKAATILRQQKHILSVLYGGNVTPSNIDSFMSLSHIDGIIAGNASLDPQLFTKLVTYA